MANNAFDTSDVIKIQGDVKGVKRISKKAKAFIFMGACVLMGFILFLIFTVGEDTTTNAQDQAAAEQTKGKPEIGSGEALFKGVGDGNAAATPSFDLNAGLPVDPSLDMSNQGQQSKPQDNSNVDLSKEAVTGSAPAPQMTREEMEKQRLLEEKVKRNEMAMQAKLEVETGAPSTPMLDPRGLPAGATAPFSATGSAAGPMGAGQHLGLQGQEQDDQNKQVRKENFLKAAGEKENSFVLREKKQDPYSPFEIKQGWKIPAFMIDGINSDLPGQVCAQVRENVYDTAIGKYLLIPQGTKVCGTWDSQIAVGQERLLMVWNRLIFDDGTSLALQGMPGTDQAGYAGFEAEVDNHYFRVFGGAVMMAVISAGAQLSQSPQQQTGNNGQPSVASTAAGALGQQLGQVSSALVQRDLKIQPTLKQEPGYRFNITVTRDIVFSGPYKRRRS